LFSVYLIRLQRASNRDSLSNSETGGRKRKHADSPDNDEEDPPVRMTGRNMKKSEFFKDPESVAVSRPRRVNKPPIEEAKEDEQIEDSEMQDDEQEDEENNQARKLVFEKLKRRIKLIFLRKQQLIWLRRRLLTRLVRTGESLQQKRNRMKTKKR
jgi:hypothetical protein